MKASVFGKVALVADDFYDYQLNAWKQQSSELFDEAQLIVVHGPSSFGGCYNYRNLRSTRMDHLDIVIYFERDGGSGYPDNEFDLELLWHASELSYKVRHVWYIGRGVFTGEMNRAHCLYEVSGGKLYEKFKLGEIPFAYRTYERLSEERYDHLSCFRTIDWSRFINYIVQERSNS